MVTVKLEIQVDEVLTKEQIVRELNIYFKVLQRKWEYIPGPYKIRQVTISLDR